MNAMASVVGQVGCLNIVIIGVALGAGLLLDRLVGTSGIFAVIFILGSVPVALFATIRIATRAIANAQALQEKRKQELLAEDDKTT